MADNDGNQRERSDRHPLVQEKRTAPLYLPITQAAITFCRRKLSLQGTSGYHGFFESSIAGEEPFLSQNLSTDILIPQIPPLVWSIQRAAHILAKKSGHTIQFEFPTQSLAVHITSMTEHDYQWGTLGNAIGKMIKASTGLRPVIGRKESRNENTQSDISMTITPQREIDLGFHFPALYDFILHNQRTGSINQTAQDLFQNLGITGFRNIQLRVGGPSGIANGELILPVHSMNTSNENDLMAFTFYYLSFGHLKFTKNSISYILSQYQGPPAHLFCYFSSLLQEIIRQQPEKFGLKKKI